MKMKQKPITFQTKEEYAYRTLRDAILRCELGPGEKLVIDRLSAELGISQIPIRGAIQRLQTEGLVIVSPHSSASVAPLSPGRVDEVFSLLESLEQTAFRAAANNVSPADLDFLDQLIILMDTAVAENNQSEWLRANTSFHQKIAEISQMPLLVDFSNRVLAEWERISHYYFEDVTVSRLPQAQKEHREILEYLRTGDTESLEALAKLHNRAANQAYQTILRDSSK
jgi:DNA-binding GntR family transcriptional regulator